MNWVREQEQVLEVRGEFIHLTGAGKLLVVSLIRNLNELTERSPHQAFTKLAADPNYKAPDVAASQPTNDPGLQTDLEALEELMNKQA